MHITLRPIKVVRLCSSYIPDSCCASTKTLPDSRGFCSHNHENGDFGPISVTERIATLEIEPPPLQDHYPNTILVKVNAKLLYMKHHLPQPYSKKEQTRHKPSRSIELEAQTGSQPRREWWCNDWKTRSAILWCSVNAYSDRHESE